MREWEQAKTLSPRRSTPLTRPNLPLPESHDVIYCNTDASWSPHTKSAGMAWIFTDQGDREISRGSIYQKFVSSPSMAEALAIRGALQHATSLSLSLYQQNLATIRLQRACSSHLCESKIDGTVWSSVGH